MQFAKKSFDIGLFSNQPAAQLDFWQQTVGLPFDHTLKLGGGLLQHRHAVGEAILKLNAARDPLPHPASNNLQAVILGLPGLSGERLLHDPDGNLIEIHPSDTPTLGLRIATPDLKASASFYHQVLGLQRLAENLLACGSSQLQLHPGGQPAAGNDNTLPVLGLRYLTLQVENCDAAWQAAIAAGARNGREPVTLGSTARIAFVIAPEGTWVELSERASLTGREPGVH